MTLHKIDRDKLAEALQDCQHMGKGSTKNLVTLNDEEYWIVEQAAENWLAITDPGFEPSEEMVDAAEKADYDGWAAYQKLFKAMIATMIRGE